MNDLVSVVVPTAGKRPELLLACLRSIVSQRIPHEILVVVVPRRSLPDEVERLARVIVHAGSISAALNEGIRRSQGDIIAITHDDCTVSDAWLQEISHPLRTYDAALCVGQSLPSRFGRGYPNTRRLSQNEVMVLADRRFRAFWKMDLVSNNFAFRRQAFRRVGLFNERLGIGSPLRGGEDWDMFHRLFSSGLTVCINPRALVSHEPLDTWQQEVKMMYTYRIGLAAYFLCHRRDRDVGEYFVREILVGQIREIWRDLRRGRMERICIDVIALLGLGIGILKSLLYRPWRFAANGRHIQDTGSPRDNHSQAT